MNPTIRRNIVAIGIALTGVLGVAGTASAAEREIDLEVHVSLRPPRPCGGIGPVSVTGARP